MINLIQDTMNVLEIHKGEHVLSQKVFRIVGKSHIYDLNVIYDVNRELFNVKQDSVLQFLICYDRTEKMNVFDSKEKGEDDFFKGWEYVTHGTVFEVREKSNDQL